MDRLKIVEFKYTDFEHIRRNGTKWCRFVGFNQEEIESIDNNNFENYISNNFQKILKIVILFKEKYCFNVLYISVNKENEVKWLLQTPSNALNKVTSIEFIVFKEFIEKIINENPNIDDLLSHWFFTINPDYIYL
jgi:hypothetical protein